ncbi:hypothetical protein [Azospirillum griseum]|uniref:Uncharacterized protein n=1 Tax=Azospirillum griseum TaxID=2496639 RepID=A0A431VN74_9PROT|nr:hypothetical protein [Azospirillum griseum]RTR24216.1 hypothetical protein EJ903_00030 [Azospirillum griseum]
MADEMSRASLKIAFDGPAIHDGTMDVRDLAPALLAIGQLCEESNRVLNGERIKAAVLVRSDFRKGSFVVDLDLVQTLVAQMKSFLVGEDATAAANLLALLGGGSGSVVGLIRIIKWLRGRRPTRLVILEHGGVRIEIDQDSIETNREAIQLLRDVEVRKAAAALIRPLEKSGIDTIAFSAGGQPPEIIDKDDASSFVVPSPEEEQIIHEERKAAYTIVSVSFKDRNKWRLFDGQNTINVTMADENFLSRVNQNDVVFAKGDILVCRVLMEQWRTTDGLRSEYTVLEVVEHRSAARQLPMQFDPPTSD